MIDFPDFPLGTNMNYTMGNISVKQCMPLTEPITQTITIVLMTKIITVIRCGSQYNLNSIIRTRISTIARLVGYENFRNC